MKKEGKFNADVARSYSMTTGRPIRRIIELWRSPGIHAVAAFRFGQWVLRQPIPLRWFFKPAHVVWNHRIMVKWGIMIQPGARIGPGFHIYHFGGIFVGEQAIIGENFSLSHDVTIGLAGEGSRRGAPRIGDEVYVAPGAKIYGRISIGNRAKIGANAIVDRNVPDYALVQVRAPQVVIFRSFYSGSDGPRKNGGEGEDLTAGRSQV